MLKYLARYTHRVAISNHRLIALEDGEVTFHWKDYAHEGKQKTMTLKAIEFIRRFLLHVLPAGFVRIRHYGFLANRVCREKLELCRALLQDDGTPSKSAAAEPVPEPKVGHRRRAPRQPLPYLRQGPNDHRRDPFGDASQPARAASQGADTRAGGDLIRPEPSQRRRSDLVTHRRQDRPWRVIVDSLSAEPDFAFTSLGKAHFEPNRATDVAHSAALASDRISPLRVGSPLA